MLNVAQISFFLDPFGRDPEQLLQDWPTLVDVAEAAARGGAHVRVIQACARAQRLTRNGIDYHFVVPSSSVAASPDFGELLRGVDVLHVHGLGFPADVLALAHLAPDVPIIVQDHAAQPPRIWRRPAWRRALAAVSGVIFCGAAQALPFVRAGVLSAAAVVHQIPESTSRFTPGDRAQARNATGLHGHPCVLWVGHLNANKDPLTVLEAVREAAQELPGLQLWCCFGGAPLMSHVRRRIDAENGLRTKVHLLGRVAHERIETLMRAADLFVLGSHREGSGYAVIEAMACGLPPIVTDIPSFRVLTEQGAVGRLWSAGDSHSLCAALLSMGSPSTEQRRAVRAHFDAELSFTAVGRKLCVAYEQALGRKGTAAASALA